MLRHRHVKVDGDQPMGFTRQFLWKNTVYEMRIPSRGYLYELDPPLPVNVLEGNIMGDVKKPIFEYVPKPWNKYPPGPPPPRPTHRRQGRRGRVLRGMTHASQALVQSAWPWSRRSSLGALALHAANQPPPLPVGVAAPPAAGGAAVGQREDRLHDQPVHQEGDGLLGQEAAGDHRAAPAAGRPAPARLAGRWTSS